jgi:lactate racemase
VTAPTLTLPWGNESLSLDLPEKWQIDGVLRPADLPAVSDVDMEVRGALAAPVGCTPLRALVRSGRHIALVIDDASRPTPISQILPFVLEELSAGGVSEADITLFTALGLHRAMTEQEISARTGPRAAGIRWLNHDCDDLAGLVQLGTTSRGTPVWVNKEVANADLIVSIGCIEPHIIASFGGGYKNLIPGVAGRATIAHNHTLNCRPDTFNMVGQPVDGNPMRLDLEECGEMIRKPVFVVNAILNSRLEVIRVVAGHPVAAHRAGAAVSASLYAAPIERPADFVVTSSFPMDQDLRQGVKALANTVRAVRQGGVHLTLVRADEGVGVFGLAERKLPLGAGALRVLAPLLLKVVPRLKLKGMGEEDRFFLYFALQAMRHATLLLYAPTIPAITREHLPFVRFVDSPAEAVEIARRKLGDSAHVLAFANGGTSYPSFPA